MIDKKTSPEQAGQFAYRELDDLVHEKTRLSIMTSLLAYPNGLLFSELKDLCKLTDGNLSRHMQILAENGLVEVWKGYRNKRPQTFCRLSEQGRERFTTYLEELWKVINEAKKKNARALETSAQYGPLPSGWVLVQ
jgi:DNA-binding MarR family transcriptional regulator